MSDEVTLHERDIADKRAAQAEVNRLAGEVSVWRDRYEFAQRIGIAAMNALRAVAPEEAQRLEEALCATA